MVPKRVEADSHLQSAGECFMFLCWAESTMRDFLVLHEGSCDLRIEYNTAYGSSMHPPEFARRRLEAGRLSFGRIKNEFLSAWPQWKDDREIRDAIERVVIYRNGFGHAQVQPFRQYLLYTPTAIALEAIREYMRCSICRSQLKNCKCNHEDVAEPLSLVFRCLDSKFLVQFYGDIRTVDVKCFLPTAKELNVAYQGVAWPRGNGFTIAQHKATTRSS